MSNLQRSNIAKYNSKWENKGKRAGMEKELLLAEARMIILYFKPKCEIKILGIGQEVMDFVP